MQLLSDKEKMMAKLILKYQGKVINTYPVKAGEFRVGRNADNDICLDDATVSGKHALILIKPCAYLYKDSFDVFIEDLGSTNGTFIGSTRVKKEQLSNGDIIQIGNHEFEFIDEDQLRFDKTMVISPKS